MRLPLERRGILRDGTPVLNLLEGLLFFSRDFLSRPIDGALAVFSGFGSVDYIRNCPVPVVSIIDGCAASAATIMSVVAEERLMHEHAFMLIHQLSSGMWVKFEEMKDDMKNNELLMKKIIGIYEEHTKIPKSKIKDILKRDLWWDAKTCLKYGLVDDIIIP